MKTTLLTFASAAFLLMSCSGGPDQAEFDTAAGKICDCMSKKNEEAAKAAESDTLGFNVDMTDLNYSLCALEVAFDVDPFDEKMGTSIETKCPDLKDVHAEYVKSSKQK
jgi:hypothetical protein